MDNVVTLVVPGLSSSSSSSSASTSRPKDHSKSSGESEASADPMTTRRAKHACGKPMQTTPDKQASANRGSAHKEDEMNPHILLEERSQIREVMLQKWRHKNGITVSILTSPKTEIATCACEPKLRGFRAEDAMRDLFHEQKS